MSAPDLSGVSETMLQTLYARAKESQKPSRKIYDPKAVEAVGRLDYDFSAADKDAAMSAGVVARTILLDAMASDWLAGRPQATVVNIASGMDTRLYRIDGSNVRRWFNVDLPEAVRVRERYISEDARVTNIGCSAMDERWADEVVKAGEGGEGAPAARKDALESVLVIVEGLSMYLSEPEVRQLLSVIDRHFPHATVFFEILSPRFVNKDIEKSISKSGAAFTFGAKSGEEVARLCPALAWKGDRSLVEGMEKVMPIYKLIGKIGPVRSLSNKIAVLEK